MSLEDIIIQRLNAELGDKVENLSKSKTLVDKYLKQLDDINDKVSSKSDDCECFAMLLNFNFHRSVLIAAKHQLLLKIRLIIQ